ncbi:MAG: HD domain-containing protein [Planctomycetota bacterium]
MTGTATSATVEIYTSVPLAGLAGADLLPFPLFLKTSPNTWVLYRDRNSHVGEEHLRRMTVEGVRELHIHTVDHSAYLKRIEISLRELLTDRRVPIERRVEGLHGVAVQMASEILQDKPSAEGVERAQRLLVNTSTLVLREPKAFKAMRVMLGASASLGQHSVSVAFLSMGLARHTLSADPSHLLTAGLAGLFHDVGRIGYESLEHDPEHCQRGSDLLRKLGIPESVCDAAMGHHERWDGSGLPRALQGNANPELARIVSLADAYETIYSGQEPRVTVYEAMRILAQAFRGCFEPALIANFLKLFH